MGFFCLIVVHRFLCALVDVLTNKITFDVR